MEIKVKNLVLLKTILNYFKHVKYPGMHTCIAFPVKPNILGFLASLREAFIIKNRLKLGNHPKGEGGLGFLNTSHNLMLPP